MKEIIFDIETDGIDATKIHCISTKIKGVSPRTEENINVTRSIFTNPSSTLIGHNIICFDLPIIGKLTDIKVTANCIDTLALSWYLFPDRQRHGLEQWGQYFGIKKVEVDDWNTLSIDVYKERCEEDVKINEALWQLCFSRLKEMYGSDKEVYRVANYLTFKLKMANYAQVSQWKVDTKRLRSNLLQLLLDCRSRTREIKPLMPKVELKSVRTRPKKMRKDDLGLTKLGQRWVDLCKEEGVDPMLTEKLEVVRGYSEPNPSSVSQVKSWLKSLGWKPATFKKNKSGEEVPQLKNYARTGLCDSVKALEVRHKAIGKLDDLYTINHRIATLRGLMANSPNGFIKAEISGFTNTLRMKHKTVVNLPSVGSDYGEYIRPVLVAREGKVLCGSDMASLEDRTKQHYMVPYDPEYVKEMTVEGFDPHLDLGIMAGTITVPESDEYKRRDKAEEHQDPRVKAKRHVAKTTNYSCTYGAFPPKIALAAQVSLEEATRVWNSYWERNHSIKIIAEKSVVKTYDGQKWIWNPVAKLWYSLRHEKDRFSTLNQGTGSFCFDTWVCIVLSKRPQLTAQFHDEIVLEVDKGKEEETTALLKWAIKETNKKLQLRRDLDVSVQYGNNYGDIH